MKHPDELLSAYLDGETTPAESAGIGRHLGGCHRCRRQLEELNLARAALRSLPTLELPLTLVASPSRAEPPMRKRPSVWVGAAAAVAAAVIAVATVATPPREPLSLTDVSRQLGARASLDVGSSPLKLVVGGLSTE